MDPSFEKALQKLVTGKRQVIAAYFDDESGEIVLSGDHRWIEALGEDVELKEALLTKLKEAKSDKDDILVKESLPPVQVIYEKLNFNINEPKKASQKKIRDYLDKMLMVQGYGKNKAKKFGKGPPPKGWPTGGLTWTEFKGATNTNNLTTGGAVRIICSMLTWAGYNPETYFEAETHIENEARVEPEPRVEDETGAEALVVLGAEGFGVSY